MVILHICDLYLNLLQFFSLRDMKNMTQINNNNISKNRENAFYPFYSTAVSRQFVSIFCAVKIIFQIRIAQEYLSTTSNADCEMLNSGMDEVENRVHSGRHLMP